MAKSLINEYLLKHDIRKLMKEAEQEYKTSYTPLFNMPLRTQVIKLLEHLTCSFEVAHDGSRFMVLASTSFQLSGQQERWGYKIVIEGSYNGIVIKEILDFKGHLFLDPRTFDRYNTALARIVKDLKALEDSYSVLCKRDKTAELNEIFIRARIGKNGMRKIYMSPIKSTKTTNELIVQILGNLYLRTTFADSDVISVCSNIQDFLARVPEELRGRKLLFSIATPCNRGDLELCENLVLKSNLNGARRDFINHNHENIRTLPNIWQRNTNLKRFKILVKCDKKFIDIYRSTK